MKIYGQDLVQFWQELVTALLIAFLVLGHQAVAKNLAENAKFIEFLKNIELSRYYSNLKSVIRLEYIFIGSKIISDLREIKYKLFRMIFYKFVLISRLLLCVLICRALILFKLFIY